MPLHPKPRSHTDARPSPEMPMSGTGPLASGSTQPATKVIIMLKRMLLAISLATGALGAAAADNTDIWSNPTEPGWGVNLVQSDNFIFATFFIYGENGSPTWYTAQLTWDGISTYTGGLFATTGTWFAAPWQAGNRSLVQAGTASFAPSSLVAHRGTLSYTVNGFTTVTKSIERQTLTTIALGGSYTGGQSGTYSACANAADNRAYADRYDLEVTQFADGNATFQFAYAATLTCTLSGMLEQHGLQYRIPTATYRCSDGVDTAAVMSEIRATAQGIEGRISAISTAGACREDAAFSAVLQ